MSRNPATEVSRVPSTPRRRASSAPIATMTPTGSPGMRRRLTNTNKTPRKSQNAGCSSSALTTGNSLWWNSREHRDARWASLTRRAREEYRAYFDRSATMSEPKARGSAGIQRASNAA